MFSGLFKSMGLRARNCVLRSPLAGRVIPLSDVGDDTFATGKLGRGVAIQPTGCRVIAPSDAKIEAIFPTGHAIAMRTVEGLDVLVHLGLETVKLEGRYFTVKVAVGQTVSQGDVLIEFDRPAIEAEGYDITAPILICNSVEFASLKVRVGETVGELDELIVARER